MSQISSEKLYESYLEKIKETDEISFKLMGLVPLVSGTSIFALLKSDTILTSNQPSDLSLPISWLLGIFGALITFFIYRWELRNVNTCKIFRKAAANLEPASGAYKKITGNISKPKLLGMPFGKEKAEHCIYILTILFWLVMPTLKTIMDSVRIVE